MEYFRSSLISVLGAPTSGTEPTGAETVDCLVNRVVSSTLLEDRRDACRALKALSRKHRLEVGTQAMDALRDVLQVDRSDCEIIGYSLEALCNITSRDTFEEEADAHTTATTYNVGEQFTEMFVKNSDNVSLVLTFLEEYDFRVRWPAVKLLTSLLASKPKEIQDIILVSPMGVSRLMDLLQENREVIRNDALLLLIQLTKSNANIQKIVAFENAFDRLFDVVAEEGAMEGGIVVEDCLLLMLNLLRNNTSNINFFKEGSYIQRLAPMFRIPENVEDVGWSPQKVSNFHCILQLVRCLVAPNNPAQVTSACQKSMRNAKLFEALCDILMASGVPADILTETISTVGEVLRGSLANQEYFAGVTAPSNPPRPAILVLLMSMVNEKQPFALRCAVLYCFACFLYQNEIGQSQVVQTLLPSASGVSTLTTGQLLCSGMFCPDATSNWLAAVALAHCLIDNAAQKEQLMRVLLATDVDAPPVTLVHQAATFLQQTNKMQAKLGILMLLSMWMAQCPPAVQLYLNVPGAVAFLTAQMSADDYDSDDEVLQGLCAFLMGICVAFNDNSVPNYSRENLSQLLMKRVTIETYTAKLGIISRHEVYAKAAKQPQIVAKHASELLLEFEFCKLFKVLESIIMCTLGGQWQVANSITELSLNEHENALLLQYKDLIREQDKRMNEVQKQCNALAQENDELKKLIDELKALNTQYKDENTIYKAKITTDGTNDEDVTQQELRARIDSLQASLDVLRKDQDDLLELLSDQDGKLTALRERLRQLGENWEDSDDDVDGS